MRIGIVLSQPPGYSETFFNSKIKGLIQNGHNVSLFCQNKTNDFDLCPVHVAPKKKINKIVQMFAIAYVFLGLLFNLTKVKKFIALEKNRGTSTKTILKKIYLNAQFFKSNLDWVHFGFATMALERELVPKAINAKLAVSFRGFDIAIYPLKHKNCYDLLWEQVDKVHTISDDLLQLAYGLGLSKEVDFQKITPAIDTGQFKSDDDLMTFDSHTIKILTVARLHWKKGLIDTLEALHLIKDKGISFSYTIVGEGDQQEELYFTLDQLDLNDHVTMLGKRSHDEVKALMASSHLYIQYSISEGFCNAVLEAQGMGLLCIVSDAEGLSENVLDGQTGCVIPKRDPLKLAQTIQDVIDYPADKKNGLRRNAIDRVRDEFNIKKQSEYFDQFYST